MRSRRLAPARGRSPSSETVLGSRGLVFVFVIAGAVACRRPPPPATQLGGADGLAALREPVADPLRARFSFKIVSAVLGLEGSTGGALIVDRPGRVHFAVLGPLGGALATVQTDGERASIVLRQQDQHIWADDVDGAVRGWTGDAFGADDVVGLLLGQVPLPESPADLFERNSGTVGYTRSGRGRSSGALEVSLEGSPLRPSYVRIVDGDGIDQLSLRYDGYAAFDAGAMPRGWTLRAPSLDLSLDVRFKSAEPIELAPDVFGTEAPEGFESLRWSELMPVEAPR